MRITITFRPSIYFDYRFHLEGSDWESIFQQVKSISDEFDKAHETVFGKTTLLDRIRGR